MMADSYYSKPQREEYFLDSGYYKFYEAYHLLKFSNEKQILEKAYNEYLDLKRSNLWGSKKYFIKQNKKKKKLLDTRVIKLYTVVLGI